MNDAQLLRYSRHILLPAVGIEGQERLLRARVLVIGLGGLGAPVAMYLAASGVGHLVLVDDDRVELSNLQRQVIHATASVGQDKVASAEDAVRALNPDVRTTVIKARLVEDALREQVRGADLVVDATDNFASRFAINAACLESRTPWVSGAVIRTEGQVAVFDPRQPRSPCYRCLYPDSEEIAETCSETGILAPVAGMIGTSQATEALKLLLGLGRSLAGRLLLLDASEMEWRTVVLPRDPHCPACAPQPG